MYVPVGISDTFPASQILTALGMFCLLLPAPSHFKSGNPGVILFITWVFITNLILFVNSIVWRGNIGNPAVLYCDITVFILAIVPTAFPCATLCINRQLWKLSRAQAVIITKAQKRRDLIIDLLIGLGIPFAVGGMHAIIQGHRYDVYEDVGCLPTTYNVVPSFPLYWMWPLLMATISAGFGGLALRQFLKRRLGFEKLLSSTNSGMQRNRYLRLMWLCSIDLLISIPVYIYNLLNNVINTKVYPWVSWADVQYDWYRVDFYRRAIIDQVPFIRIMLIEEIVSAAALALMFFLVFGFSREATKSYVNFFYWALKPFGVKRPQRTPPMHHGPPKRTLLDKILGREAKPAFSFSNTTGSIPAFGSQTRTIPSSRPKVTHTLTSQTDTLNWEDERSPDAQVHVVDGKRLTIPGLHEASTFGSSSSEIYEKNPDSPTSSVGYRHSPV